MLSPKESVSFKRLSKYLSAIGLVFALALTNGCSLGGFGVSPMEKLTRQSGVFKSTDGGTTFTPQNKISENEDLSAASVLTIAINPTEPQKIFLGTEKAGIYFSENNGQDWRFVNDAQQVYHIAVHPREGHVIYAAGVWSGQGKIIKSTDSGQTWTDVYSETEGNIISSLALDPFNPETVYAGNSAGKLFKSSSGGRDWMSLGTLAGPIIEIAFDAADTRNIYLLVEGKGIYKVEHTPQITDEDGEFLPNINDSAAGPDIVELEDNLPQGINAADTLNLTADPQRGNVVYATGFFGIIRSENGGQTWQLLPTLEESPQNSSDGVPIRSLAIGGANSQLLYYGARGVFYRSANYGQSWETLEFKTNYVIEDLALEPGNEQIIYLGIRRLKD